MNQKRNFSGVRPKTSVLENKVKYFTTGRQINKKKLRTLEDFIQSAYKIPENLKTLEEAKKFWLIEKENKSVERKGNYKNRHTFKS